MCPSRPSRPVRVAPSRAPTKVPYPSYLCPDPLRHSPTLRPSGPSPSGDSCQSPSVPHLNVPYSSSGLRALPGSNVSDRVGCLSKGVRVFVGSEPFAKRPLGRFPVVRTDVVSRPHVPPPLIPRGRKAPPEIDFPEVGFVPGTKEGVTSVSPVWTRGPPSSWDGR